MNRFHKLMSWESPTDQGTSSSNHSDKQDANSFDNAASETPPEEWNTHAPTDDDAYFSCGSWAQRATYRTHFLPVHYTASYEYPLIVWLHSNGFNENQVDQVLPHVSLRNYVGLGVRATHAVDAIGHCFAWRHNPSGVAAAHESILEAIEEAASRFAINERRIVLAGYQDGGTMALRIALREPNRFAGVVSLGGNMPMDGIRNLHELQQRRMPMLWQWAQGNAAYTPAAFKSNCQTAMSTGSKVDVRQYQGDDEMETVVLRDIDDWIMRRIIPSATSDSDRWASSPTAYSNN